MKTQEQSISDRRWLKSKEVKRIYSLTDKKLRKLREQGLITYKPEGNCYLYLRDSLEVYFNAGAIEAKPQFKYVKQLIPIKEVDTTLKGGKMPKWKKVKSTNGRFRLDCGDFSLIRIQGKRGVHYYMDIRGEKRRTLSLKKLAGRPIQDSNDAFEAARRIRNKMYEEQSVLENPDITFSEFVPVYLADKKSDNLRSFSTIRSVVENRLDPWFGPIKLKEINLQALKKYRDYRRKTIDDSTIKNELGYLKEMYNLAADSGYELGPNPVNFRKLKFHITERERYMRIEEEAVIWPLLKKYPPMEDLATFILNTAMRHGNICSLRREQIHWDEKEAFVPKEIHKQKGKDGHYLLNDKVLKILKRRQKDNGDFPFVFYRYEGSNPKPITIRWIQRQWDKVMKEAGIEDLNFYDLKHTCLSRNAAMGASVFTLKAISNHSSTTSLEKYVKKDACKEAALEYLNRMTKVWDCGVKNGVKK